MAKIVACLKCKGCSLVDFLELATTLKVLGCFAIFIKRLAFNRLVLRFFGKIHGFVFCSFLRKLGFSLQ